MPAGATQYEVVAPQCPFFEGTAAVGGEPLDPAANPEVVTSSNIIRPGEAIQRFNNPSAVDVPVRVWVSCQIPF
ncbi:hypothetical protein [Streptomyces sp. PTD5-9]|uniref:hypothetical protein n=1 Tax=Streptomyces sp. PTD5-9 TaxID=3120150 RepID=UPI00300B0BA9